LILLFYNTIHANEEANVDAENLQFLFVTPSGNVKGWEFGERERIACANVDGTFYAIQGGCPRCAFDLYKGDLITDESFEDLPRLACPTCSTTFSLKNGFYGPALKRTGLAGFVANLSKTATINDAMVNAKAFVITREEDTGRVFMREK